MANPEDFKPVVPHPRPPSEQSASAPPVVTASDLPPMEKVGEVKTVLKTPNLPLMGTGAPVSTGDRGLMAAVPPQRTGSSPLRGTPQEPKRTEHPSPPSDGYVRMEIHVDNGQLSVTGIKEVPGPFINPNTVIRGYVYEVLINDQQVALGSIPDVGLRRAFANRDVPGPQGKHYFIDTPKFDFFVRIPKVQVSRATLPKLTILLHNVQDAPDRFTSSAPLQKQPDVKTTEVGRLSGIKLDLVPRAVRPQFEEILKQNENRK